MEACACKALLKMAETGMSKVEKFKSSLREEGLAKALGRALNSLTFDFRARWKIWGLGYAIEVVLIRYLPPRPFLLWKIRRKVGETPRLQLGSGKSICSGWLHQDLKRGKGIDFAVDVRRLKKYVPHGSLDAVFCSHMLEHLSRPEAMEVLGDIFKWLHPGGQLWFAVPDLEVMLAIAKDPAISDTSRHGVMMLVATPWPGHVSAWFHDDLVKILKVIGYSDIEVWADPPSEFANVKGCWDYKFEVTPISLNLRARKPEMLS